jgi:hypothetical protein
MFKVVPEIKAGTLPAIIRYAVIGALIAAVYGIVHDEVTYSISPEYFTKLKFAQFHYADFGLPRRVFVAEVGVLATWWVGFISGWFMARMAVPRLEPEVCARKIWTGFAILFAIAVAGSLVGYTLGLKLPGAAYLGAWLANKKALGLDDLRSFVRVAYIHNSSYLGGLCGLVTALIYLRRGVRKIA